MKSSDFCYWLQGYFELSGSDNTTLTSQQIQIIKNHLALVFKHEIDTPDPTGELQDIHDGNQLTVIPISDPNHPVNHSTDPLQNPNALFRC